MSGRWRGVQFAWEQRVGERAVGLRCAGWVWVPGLLDEEETSVKLGDGC